MTQQMMGSTIKKQSNIKLLGASCRAISDTIVLKAKIETSSH